MNLAVDPSTLVAFLLVMTRLLAAFVTAPPFAGVLVPFRVRVALAVSVALVVAPTQHSDVRLAVGPLMVALVYQVVVGGLFGYLVQLVLSAPLMAGALIDNLSGFSVAGLFDPFSASSTTPAARLNQLVTTMILILLEGHLLVVRGVLRTYQAAPLSGLRVDSLRGVLSDAIGQLMLAAIEVGLPLLVALLMAELVLAMAARAAPQLNVMVVGFALKSLVFTIGFAVGLPLLVNASSGLLEHGLRWAVQVGGG
ncbi:MAG: flagellar biosynthetic protein FliR [Acidimicrobiales bacterium]